MVPGRPKPLELLGPDRRSPDLSALWEPKTVKGDEKTKNKSILESIQNDDQEMNNVKSFV